MYLVVERMHASYLLCQRPTNTETQHSAYAMYYYAAAAVFTWWEKRRKTHNSYLDRIISAFWICCVHRAKWPMSVRNKRSHAINQPTKKQVANIRIRHTNRLQTMLKYWHANSSFKHMYLCIFGIFFANLRELFVERSIESCAIFINPDYGWICRRNACWLSAYACVYNVYMTLVVSRKQSVWKPCGV